MYRLEGKECIPMFDCIEWGRWFQDADRIVKRDDLKCGENAILVSTVFLGLDHGWGEGKPILFETMVFLNGKQWNTGAFFDRYNGYDEAVKGHLEILKKVKAELKANEKNGDGK